MIKTLGISLAVATVLGMSGCGSSSSNDDTTPPPNGGDTVTTTVSGKVADGYLDKAKVCLDKNENGKCDENEPNTLSVNGSYDLNIKTADIGDYPILVEVTTTTIDLDDGSYVTKPYTLTAPKDSTGFISPITTLIKSQIDNNPALTTDEAISIVSRELNITDDNSKLLTDYVIDEDTNTVSKQLHEIGKVLARLIVNIEENIKTTLGITNISDDQRAGLSKIVNDVALDNISVIASKIKNDNKDISELTSDISTIVAENSKTQTEFDLEVKEAKLSKTFESGTIVALFNGEVFFDFEDHEQDYLRLRAKIFDPVQGYKEAYSDINSSTDDAENNLATVSSSKPPIYEELEDGKIKIGDDDKVSIVSFGKLDLNSIDYTFGEIINKLYRGRSPYESDLKNQFPNLENNSNKAMNFSSGDFAILSTEKYIKHTENPQRVGVIKTRITFNKSAMDKILKVLQDSGARYRAKF